MSTNSDSYDYRFQSVASSGTRRSLGRHCAAVGRKFLPSRHITPETAQRQHIDWQSAMTGIAIMKIHAQSLIGAD
ncbi:MAG: hypothetical protein ABF665_00090 [Gluconacetobacter sp.]